MTKERGVTFLLVSLAAFLCAQNARPQTVSFSGEAARQKRLVAYRQLLEKKQFQDLDAAYARLLKEATHEDPLHWETSNFYDAFAELPEPRRTDLLQAWVAARPSSPAARVAFARAAYDYAWEQRGDTYSNRVGTTAMRSWGEGLAEAAKRLQQAKSMNAADGEFWRLVIAVTGELQVGDVRQVSARAARSTQDPAVFRTAGWYLLARWGGTTDALEPFARDAARMTTGSLGPDGMYAVIAMGIVKSVDMPEWESYHFDRDRLRRGCVYILTAAPRWQPSYHRCADLAAQTADHAFARGLFRKPELEWYDGAEKIWDSRDDFEEARRWSVAVQ